MINICIQPILINCFNSNMIKKQLTKKIILVDYTSSSLLPYSSSILSSSTSTYYSDLIVIKFHSFQMTPSPKGYSIALLYFSVRLYLFGCSLADACKMKNVKLCLFLSLNYYTAGGLWRRLRARSQSRAFQFFTLMIICRIFEGLKDGLFIFAHFVQGILGHHGRWIGGRFCCGFSMRMLWFGNGFLEAGITFSVPLNPQILSRSSSNFSYLS